MDALPPPPTPRREAPPPSSTTPREYLSLEYEIGNKNSPSKIQFRLRMSMTKSEIVIILIKGLENSSRDYLFTTSFQQLKEEMLGDIKKCVSDDVKLAAERKQSIQNALNMPGILQYLLVHPSKDWDRNYSMNEIRQFNISYNVERFTMADYILNKGCLTYKVESDKTITDWPLKVVDLDGEDEHVHTVWFACIDPFGP